MADHSYSSDLSGLRDELLGGLRELRKDVHKESEKVGRAIGDGYEDGYEDSVEVVRKSKEELLDELSSYKTEAEKILRNLPKTMQKSLQAFNFNGLQTAIRKLKRRLNDVQDVYNELQEIGEPVDTSWMDEMIQKAGNLASSFEKQIDVSDKVVEATKKQKKATAEQTKETEKAAAAQEKLNKAQQKGVHGTKTKATSSDKKTSTTDTDRLLKGTNFDSLLKELNILKQDRAAIKAELGKFASLVSEYIRLGDAKEDVSDIEAQVKQQRNDILHMIKGAGSVKVEKDRVYEDFYQHMKGILIGYTEDTKKEFGGKEEWKAVINRFRGVLSSDIRNPKVLMADELYQELLEIFPHLFDAETTNEHDQLIAILEVLQKARDEHANKSKTTSMPLPNEAIQDVFVQLTESIHVIGANSREVRKELEAATKQEEALAMAAESAEKSISKQATSANNVKNSIGDIEGGAAEAIAIAAEHMDKAVGNIRDASQNTNVDLFSDAVSNGDILKGLEATIDHIVGSGNFQLLSSVIQGDKATISIQDKDTGSTINYVYRLVDGFLQLDENASRFKQTYQQIDIAHEIEKANASVSKLEKSLHGAKLDGLEELKKAANSIANSSDLEKFNKMLDVAKINASALASEYSTTMNSFASMQNKMAMHEGQVEKLKANLSALGDVDGAKQAAEAIDRMTAAAEKFKSATSQAEQKAFFKEYQDAETDYNKYYTKAQGIKKQTDAENKQIKQYYNEILNTVNKINALDVEITGLKEKNTTGLFTGLINQLQQEKDTLISKVSTIAQEVSDKFGGVLGSNKYSLSGARFFSDVDTSNINNFLNSVRAQSELTEQDIQELANAFTQSQKNGVEAANQIYTAWVQVQQISQQMQQFGDTFGFNTNNADYQGLDGAINAYNQLFAQLSQKDFTDWTAEETAGLQKLSEEIVKYSNILTSAMQKEAQYFSGKTKYSQDTTMSNMAQSTTEDTKQLLEVQKKLEQAARSFAKESGAGDAFVTKFTQGADGIAKLDFSVFDTATNSLRNFRMEMGSVSEGMYVTETTVSKSIANIQAAQQQIQSIGTLINRLDVSGINVNPETATGKVSELLNLLQRLKTETARGDSADQTYLTKLTNEAKLCAAEIAKSEKQMIQMQDAVANGSAQNLGKVDLNGNAYVQMVDKINEFATAQHAASVEIGAFDEKTGKLSFTLNSASGVASTFQASMDGLSGQVTVQQSGVTKLTTSWDRFKSSLSQTGKHLATALVGTNVFYKALAEVKKGIGYVKEIDLALTELKKVTDETEESYKKFLNTAVGTAGEIGSTVSDFTEATANFARLNI